VIETQRQAGAIPGKLPMHDCSAVVFEKCDVRGAVRKLEKIVPIAIVADAGAQFQAQQITVKPYGGYHVVGDECEMIYALQVHDNLPFVSGQL
jgi:hypothetical protein